MEWHPVLDVASRDLAGDAALLREVLADLGRQAGAAGGWRLDAEARLAAGWRFYAVQMRRPSGSVNGPPRPGGGLTRRHP